MTGEEARRRAQELLLEAKGIMDVVSDLAKIHGLDGLSFMSMTFHSTRDRSYGRYELYEPGWYDNEFWASSTADCEVYGKLIGGPEEEE